MGENPLNRKAGYLSSIFIIEYDKDIVYSLMKVKVTIAYGGILAVKCIGINTDYTMSISLLVLKILAADFDGDTLNIMLLLNKDFINLAKQIISPRQMFISRNDGRCNSDLIHSRDTIINANSLKSLYKYTPEQIERIRYLQYME